MWKLYCLLHTLDYKRPTKKKVKIDLSHSLSTFSIYSFSTTGITTMPSLTLSSSLLTPCHCNITATTTTSPSLVWHHRHYHCQISLSLSLRSNIYNATTTFHHNATPRSLLWLPHRSCSCHYHPHSSTALSFRSNIYNA